MSEFDKKLGELGDIAKLKGIDSDKVDSTVKQVSQAFDSGDNKQTEDILNKVKEYAGKNESKD